MKTMNDKQYFADIGETECVVASLQRFIECGWDFPINSEN